MESGKNNRRSFDWLAPRARPLRMTTAGDSGSDRKSSVKRGDGLGGLKAAASLGHQGAARIRSAAFSAIM